MPLGDTLHTNTFLWKEVAKQFPGEDLRESLKADYVCFVERRQIYWVSYVHTFRYFNRFTFNSNIIALTPTLKLE